MRQSSLEIEAVAARLTALASECEVPGWDGYGALPIEAGAIARAMALIRALPEGVPIPELAAEPDGGVAMDWCYSRNAMVSMSVGARGDLPYAWIDGLDRGHGVATWDESSFPSPVLQRIRLSGTTAEP